MASSFNSLCASEGSGHETLQGRQEEEGGVRYTIHKSARAWAVCSSTGSPLAGGCSVAASLGEGPL